MHPNTHVQTEICAQTNTYIQKQTNVSRYIQTHKLINTQNDRGKLSINRLRHICIYKCDYLYKHSITQIHTDKHTNKQSNR